MRTVLAFGLLVAPTAAVWADDGPPSPVRTIPLRPAAEPTPALRYRLMPPGDQLTPGNALIGYNRARALLRAGERRPDGARVDPPEAPWDEFPAEASREYVRERAAFFDELDAAARCRSCDWGWDGRLRFDRLSAVFEELQQFREMSRALGVRTRLAVVEGRFDDAIASQQTGFAMARHLAEGPTLLHALVGNALATVEIGQAEELIRRPGAPNLYWALATLPRPFADLRAPLAGEARLQASLLPDAAVLSTSPLSPARAGEMLRLALEHWSASLATPGGEEHEPEDAAALARRHAPAARDSLKRHGHDAALVASMPDAQAVLLAARAGFVRRNEAVTALMLLPPPEALARLAEFADDAPDEETAGGRLVPLSGDAMTRVLRSAVRIDRLVAGLMVVEAIRMHAAAHDGAAPDDLESLALPVPSDPLTGRPFVYEAGPPARVVAPPPDGETPGVHNAAVYELPVPRP